MTNAVNRDAICNCLFRYLAENKECCSKADVIDKIASIINKYVSLASLQFGFGLDVPLSD